MTMEEKLEQMTNDCIIRDQKCKEHGHFGECRYMKLCTAMADVPGMWNNYSRAVIVKGLGGGEDARAS